MQTLKKLKKTTRIKNKTHCIVVSGVHSAIDKVGLAKEIQKNISGSSSYKYLDPCLNVLKPKTKNYTTIGQIMNDIIVKERKGDYLGATVQVTPHVTEAIRQWIVDTDANKTITVIGGNVGDMENLVVLESIREMRMRENVKIILYAPVPYLEKAGELKTKPVQHVTKEAMKLGIHPDALCLDSDKELRDPELKKIELYTAVPKKNIVWHTNGIKDCAKTLTKIIYG